MELAEGRFGGFSQYFADVDLVVHRPSREIGQSRQEIALNRE
jgi:hypothetical protein